MIGVIKLPKELATKEGERHLCQIISGYLNVVQKTLTGLSTVQQSQDPNFETIGLPKGAIHFAVQKRLVAEIVRLAVKYQKVIYVTKVEGIMDNAVVHAPNRYHSRPLILLADLTKSSGLPAYSRAFRIQFGECATALYGATMATKLWRPLGDPSPSASNVQANAAQACHLAFYDHVVKVDNMECKTLDEVDEQTGLPMGIKLGLCDVLIPLSNLDYPTIYANMAERSSASTGPDRFGTEEDLFVRTSFKDNMAVLMNRSSRFYKYFENIIRNTDAICIG